MAEVVEQIKELVLEANGETIVTPDPVSEGVAALQSVKVVANVPSALPATLSVIENGTYTPQEGSMYNSVTVNVPSAELDSLTVTENGTYTAEEGKGYDEVVVNTPVVRVKGQYGPTLVYRGSGCFEQITPPEGYDAFANVSPMVQTKSTGTIYCKDATSSRPTYYVKDYQEGLLDVGTDNYPSHQLMFDSQIPNTIKPAKQMCIVGMGNEYEINAQNTGAGGPRSGYVTFQPNNMSSNMNPSILNPMKSISYSDYADWQFKVDMARNNDISLKITPESKGKYLYELVSDATMKSFIAPYIQVYPVVNEFNKLVIDRLKAQIEAAHPGDIVSGPIDPNDTTWGYYSITIPTE